VLQNTSDASQLYISTVIPFQRRLRIAEASMSGVQLINLPIQLSDNHIGMFVHEKHLFSDSPQGLFRFFLCLVSHLNDGLHFINLCFSFAFIATSEEYLVLLKMILIAMHFFLNKFVHLLQLLVLRFMIFPL
jgi:hypothetical protein